MHEPEGNVPCPTLEVEPQEQTAYMYVTKAVDNQRQTVVNFF